MGNLIVGIIVLAAALNAVRTMRGQKRRMKDWNCAGDCSACKTPCQAKRIYHKETLGPK